MTIEIETTTDETLAPTRLHRLMTSYIEAKAVFAGVEFGIFEALEAQPDTAEGLAHRLDLPERPVRALLTALRGSRMVERTDGVYTNTRWASTFMVRSAAHYLGDFAMHQNAHFNNFARLTEAIRENKSLTRRVQKDGYSNQGAAEGEAREGTRRFIKALHGSALLQAEHLAEKLDLAQTQHLADLGCGSGAYSIVLAQRNPRLRITAMDYPAVCEIAQEYGVAAGVSDQVTFKPGDIFREPFPEGCDGALLSHVLDGYGREQARQLLERIYQWLPSGKQLFMHSHIPSRASVPFPYGFGLILLVNTEAGEVHDEDILMHWLTDIGYHNLELTEVTALSCLITCKK